MTKPIKSGAAKKAYRKPVLLAYGNIHAITRSVGKVGAADGGMGSSMDKTM